MNHRTAVSTALLLGGLIAAAPAAAQEQPLEVFHQAFELNPFEALLHERPVVSGFTTAELGNNTLNVGDVVAVAHLRDDIKPTDLLLIGGLVPAGRDATLAGRADAVLSAGGYQTPYGNFGFQLGHHVLSKGMVPRDVARLAREGAAGDTFHVDFGGLGGRYLSYSGIGAIGLWELPLLPGLEKAGVTRMQAGAGARLLFGAGYSTFTFSGVDGGRQAPATVTHDGIDTNLRFANSIDRDRQGGLGFATDLYLRASFGPAVVVNALVADLGQITARAGHLEVRELHTEGASLRQFMDALQEVEADTLAGADERLGLPPRVRLDGSYAIHPRLAVGAAIDYRIGRTFGFNPRLLTGQVAYEATPWLPLRAGLSLGGDAGMAGLDLGAGLRFSNFQLDTGLTSTGGITPTRFRGGTFRTSMAVFF